MLRYGQFSAVECGIAVAEAEAEFREHVQAAIGELQAPQRRQPGAGFVEIARQYRDQLVPRVKQIERRHEDVAHQRGVDPVDQPGQRIEAVPDLALIVAHKLLA